MCSVPSTSTIVEPSNPGASDTSPSALTEVTGRTRDATAFPPVFHSTPTLVPSASSSEPPIQPPRTSSTRVYPDCRPGSALPPEVQLGHTYAPTPFTFATTTP